MKIADYNQMMAYLTRPEPLPQPKPEELLKIQEQNRKDRLRKTMEELDPVLMDESLDFIKRKELKVAGFVNQIPIDTGKVKPGYITGQELEELTGIPNLKNKAKELMYAPKESKRQKNIFGDFYRKDLKARYFNIGQGGKFGTLHYKKPTAEQIKQIKNYHLRTGAKYGLTDETIANMKKFYNDPTLRKYIRKGEIIPEEVLKAKGIGINQAANVTFRLAQHLNGKDFPNVNVDIPRNKSLGKKIFNQIAKAPFGNPYQVKAYQNALSEITEELGPEYFEGSKPNMDLMKREARRILNKEGVPTFDPTVKGSTGFNVNEIIGVKTGARVPGMAPYSQFINIMEGKLNAEQYGNFVRQFEKFANRMQIENKSDVIKDYKKYTKKFLENNPGLKETDLPKFSLKSPEAVYGKKRIAELADSGIDIKSSYDDIGYTVDVGKKTRTLKEFIADPKNIGKLKKFGAKGALAAGVLSLPSVVQASEEGTEDEDSILPEAAVGTAAVAPLATKKGRSIYGKAGKGLLKALRVLGQPSVAAGFAIDEARKGNIKTAGASLLAPELVGSLAPAGKGILSRAGSILMNPFGRAARAFTPVGLATIGAGALKDVYDEYQRREALTDEERLEEDLEAQEKFDEIMIGAAEGGRIGFADGPEDPSKRKFMKLMGILSLLPFGIGKFVKPAAKVAPAAAEGVKLGMDKLMMLVDKIKLLGKDVTPTYGTKEREKVTLYKGKDGSNYELVEDLSTGDIKVTREAEGGATVGDESFDVIEDRSEFSIRRGEEGIKDEGLETQKSFREPDEYDEGKAVFDQDGTIADVDEVDDATIKAIEDEIN